MLLVPAAGSVTTFLLAWELMAIASLVLVLTEHRRPAVRAAAIFYAVMTQLGFATILLGLMVLAASGGSDTFSGIGAPSDGVRTAVFVLTLAGFGSKAGLVPLHAWLPRAHPEAPSPVSALMSAAMVNLGVYGIIRIDLHLGGLARRMPATTILFGIAALGASGLPLGAGFVSEWLLVQSLIHARPDHHTVVALATPLAVGAVALTTGLGVAAMVKAFGIGFLARARSTAAEKAREAPGAMITGMAIAAVGCVVLAVAPVVAAPTLRHVLKVLPASRDTDVAGLGVILHLPGIDGSMAPGLIAAALLAAVLIAVGLARWRASRRPDPATSPPWACGAHELTPRMQYTATSFAQPLQRVFDDVLRPDTDIEVTHVAESDYHVEKIAYRARLTDAIQDRLSPPVLLAVAACAQMIRRAHTGSVHLYLGYGALGVLIVLVVAR